MPRGSSELVSAKVAFVKETVSADKSLLMYAVAKKVKEKFGETLAPDKLRVAFLEAGGAIKPRNRRKPAYETAAEKTVETAPRSNRRAVGRRRADKASAEAVRTLVNLGRYIVVVRNGDAPEIHEFDSPAKAKEFLSGKLTAGVPASALAFYSREALQLSVGI